MYGCINNNVFVSSTDIIATLSYHDYIIIHMLFSVIIPYLAVKSRARREPYLVSDNGGVEAPNCLLHFLDNQLASWKRHR